MKPGLGQKTNLWFTNLPFVKSDAFPAFLSLPEPFEAEPIPPVPSCCPSWQFSSCLSCEESPGYLEQLIDSCLQPDAPSEPAFSAFQPSSHYSPDTFQPAQLCSSQALVSFGTQGSSHRCPQGERESPSGAQQQQCGDLAAFRSLGCSWVLSGFPWGAPNELGEAAGWGTSLVEVLEIFCR